MAAFNKFNAFAADMPNGLVDLATDQLVIALTAVAPVATNSLLTDLTQVSYTNLSSRNLTTTSSTQTGGLYKLFLVNLTLTASGGSSAGFRYFVIYDSTAAGSPLIAWFDYGSTLTLASGDSVTISFDQTLGVFELQ